MERRGPIVAAALAALLAAGPAGGASSRSIAIAAPTGVAYGDGLLWVTSASDTVRRIDASSGSAVGAPIRVGRVPRAIVVAHGSAFVASSPDGTVTPVAANAASVAGTPLRVGLEPLALTVLGNEVWVANTESNSVEAIDAGSRAVVHGNVHVEGTGPDALAAGDGFVWIANIGTVTRIDAATGRVVGPPIRVGSGPDAIAASPGAVWVANLGSGTLARIATS